MPADILEADELWYLVYERWNKRWLWKVMCRRMRQIVAFVIVDRNERTCHRLWEQIPPAYQACHNFSDFWEAYQQVFPVETPACVVKGSGQIKHMERWHNTLKQSRTRFVRKTLSNGWNQQVIINIQKTCFCNQSRPRKDMIVDVIGRIIELSWRRNRQLEIIPWLKFSSPILVKT